MLYSGIGRIAVLAFLAITASGCAITVPVVAIEANGSVWRGTATASLSGGSFQVSSGSLRCVGTYDAFDYSTTITMPVQCNDGRAGVVTSTRNGLQGSGRVRLSNGTIADFVFGNAALGISDIGQLAQEEQSLLSQQAADEEANRRTWIALICGAAGFATRTPLTTNLNCQAAALSGSASSGDTSINECTRTGHAYNSKSGNSYECSRSEGEVKVVGYNLRTGSRWQTEIRNNGDEFGTDAGGNNWTYDAATSIYYNYGTGQRCTGTGAGRVCTH